MRGRPVGRITGVGGGSLMTPILVLLFGLRAAIAVVLAAVGIKLLLA